MRILLVQSGIQIPLEGDTFLYGIAAAIEQVTAMKKQGRLWILSTDIKPVVIIEATKMRIVKRTGKFQVATAGSLGDEKPGILWIIFEQLVKLVFFSYPTSIATQVYPLAALAALMTGTGDDNLASTYFQP